MLKLDGPMRPTRGPLRQPAKGGSDRPIYYLGSIDLGQEVARVLPHPVVVEGEVEVATG